MPFCTIRERFVLGLFGPLVGLHNALEYSGHWGTEDEYLWQSAAWLHDIPEVITDWMMG